MSLLCPIFRYLLLVKWTFYQLAINIFIGCILHFPSWWPDRESVPHKHIREASWLQDKDYQPRKVQVIPFGPGLWFQEINTKHFPNLNPRVRPSTGSISPGQSVTVEIHVSGQKEASSNLKWRFSKIVDITFDQVASLSRDKFLVTAVLLDREDIPASQLADALRTQTPDGQYRSPFVDHDDLHDALTMLFSDYAAIWREPLRQDPGLVQSMQVHFLLVLRLLRTQQDRCGKGPTNSFGDEGLFSCLLRFY